MNKKTLNFLIVFSIVTFSMCSYCYADNFFDKFKRGVINTLTGWVEIPKKIIETSKEENLFKGLTTGLARGVGNGVARTAVGLCETTTFIAPIPKSNYEPIMKPEHIFTKDKKDKKEEKNKTK